MSELGSGKAVLAVLLAGMLAGVFVSLYNNILAPQVNGAIAGAGA